MKNKEIKDKHLFYYESNNIDKRLKYIFSCAQVSTRYSDIKK